MADTETIARLALVFERGESEGIEDFGGIHGLASLFGTDLNDGISDTEISSKYSDRINKWGVNVLPDPPAKSWCRLFAETFKDLMLRMLIALSIIGLILTVISNIGQEDAWIHIIDPIAILISVAIVSCVEAQVNYKQQKSFNSVSKLKNCFDVNVKRGGEQRLVKSTELMAGDVLLLQAGDAVPVDCAYISGHALKIDNSQNTGEPIPISITEASPLITSGAAVDSGEGSVLVCGVGPYSMFGRTLQKLEQMNELEEETPLQKKLDYICKQVTYIGLFGSLATLTVLVIIWIVNVSGKEWDSKNFSVLMENVMVAITMFIGAIPEGLPLAVVISLGYSMNKMMEDNNFVRHLKACETMGGATTICSDKTGTLTQNKMTVVIYHMDDQDFEGKPEISQQVMDLFAESVTINTNAYMTIKSGKTTPEWVGKSTECALMKFVADCGYDYKEIRDKYSDTYVHEFNSTRKRMSTIIRHDHGYRIHVKGAPELLIKRCKYYLHVNGERSELDEETTEAIVTRVNEFADDQLRTMLITYNDLGTETFDSAWEDPANVEKDLTVIGICGIRDPLRPEVPRAIEQCKQAGVMVRMVTGDNINTAMSIARQCGILTDDGHAILGKEFSSMSKVKLIEKLPKLQVMARSSPLDKYRLVSLLMECGETVAVTGDGSNDSTALRKADVGLAMGMCGTELAKMASDIVILDDNFSSIVSALKWGRCIYDNVRSFLQFQLTVNVCALLMTFVGSLVLKKSPLRAIQLLWVSLIMDSIGALALATKKPYESLLNRPPYGNSSKLISRLMIRNIAGHAIWQSIILTTILFGAERFYKIDLNVKDSGQTFFFNTFVFFQVFNLLNARVADQSTPFFEGLFSNGIFWMLFILIVAIQTFLVEFGGSVFGTCGLNWKHWLISVAFGATELVYGAILRLFKVKDETTELLIVNREEKRESLRRRYTGMTPTMMWREPEEGKPGPAIPQAPPPIPVVRRHPSAIFEAPAPPI
jgi:Ca2+-transporting ATPase